MIIFGKLCEANHGTKRELIKKYIYLIKITGDDSIGMIENLQETAVGGSVVLLGMIKIPITAYSASMTRNAQTALASYYTSGHRINGPEKVLREVPGSHSSLIA